MQPQDCTPVKFSDIKIKGSKIQNLEFKIRHNLVDDPTKAKRKLKSLMRNAS